jgi:hypothetical protein
VSQCCLVRFRIKTEFPFVREVTKCAAEVAVADLRQAINTYYKTSMKPAGVKSFLDENPPTRQKAARKKGGSPVEENQTA